MAKRKVPAKELRGWLMSLPGETAIHIAHDAHQPRKADGSINPSYVRRDYRDAKTVGELGPLHAGLRFNDIKWDIDHGHIKFEQVALRAAPVMSLVTVRDHDMHALMMVTPPDLARAENEDMALAGAHIDGTFAGIMALENLEDNARAPDPDGPTLLRLHGLAQFSVTPGHVEARRLVADSLVDAPGGGELTPDSFALPLAAAVFALRSVPAEGPVTLPKNMRELLECADRKEWMEAAAKEVKRNETMFRISAVPMQAYRDLLDEYGPERVSIGNIVFA
jgi:hypothetical protein